MTEKKRIKLEKTVKSNIYASKLNDHSFNTLAKPQEHINNQKIKDTYDKIKYKIPKFGKNSHEAIVKQSTEYIYPNINSSIEDSIELLTAKLGGLNQQLAIANLPDPAHHLYANGNMLIAGDATTSEKYTGMDTVWVMDRGVKRSFANETLYKEVRKAFNHPGDLYSELIYLTLPELNAIPDGKAILSGEDLSIPISEINADYGGIYFENENNILLLQCQGQEVNDTYDLLAGDYYVDNTKNCIVKYIEDDFQDDGISDKVRTVSIQPGETVEIKALKYAGLPYKWKDKEEMYNMYYDYSTETIVTSSQTPGVFPEAWENEIGEDVNEFNSQNLYSLSVQPGRKWGKDREYKGIVFASGRIDILKINNKTIGASGASPYQEWFLNTKDTTSNLPSSLSFNEEISGNKKIYNLCMQLDGTSFEMCHGRLNQDVNNTKLSQIFTSGNSYGAKYYADNHRMSMAGYDNYGGNEGFGGDFNSYNIYGLSEYDKIWNSTYDFYGQPLLKGANGNHLIVLDIDPNSLLIWFFDLNQNIPFSQPWEVAQQKYMMVKEGVITPNSINDWEPIIIGNYHFNWEKVNSARLSYIGLIDSQPNRALGQGNYWNFKTSLHGQIAGSDYRLTVDSQQKIDANLQSQHTVGCESHNEYSLTQFYYNNNSYDPSFLPEGCHWGNCIDC